MKTKFYLVVDGNESFSYLLEKNAIAEGEVRNVNFTQEEVSKKEFKKMLKDGAFLDIVEYNKANKKGERQEQTKSEKEEAGKEPEIKTEDLQLQINELLQQMEEMKTENAKLKKGSGMNLETAKKLYDEKVKLSQEKEIFTNAIEKIENAFSEFDNVIDFDENTSFRLVLNAVNFTQQEQATVFSIANNHVIKELLSGVQAKTQSKISAISERIIEIESL